ncbi:MAG: sulfite exporter TauE/SafE family protein [Desulfovibrio sp.]
MLQFFYFNILWLLAGFVTGITSFGGNLLAIPLIALVLPPREAILYGCISGAAVFLGVTLPYLKQIIWRETVILSLVTFPGIPFGIWFLANAGPGALLLAAGASLASFLSWQFIGMRLDRRQNPVPIWAAIPFGFISGIMMSAVGMGGPPLVLYAFLRHWQKEETIATVNMVSVVIMLVVVPWQHGAGLFTPQILKMGAIGALFGFIGIAASIPVLHRMNIALFRRLLLAMLSFSAIVLVARGISAL